MNRKLYLGDGVYVTWRPWADGSAALELTTEDGITVTNRIVLEPEIFATLCALEVQRKAKATA